MRNSTATSALRALMLGSVAAAAVAAVSTSSMAGGFAVREQSAEFQGMSFAGNAAAGGGLSGMFWNPAVVAQFNGIRSESHFSLIMPDSEINALPGTTLIGVPGLDRSSGDIGPSAVVPAGYLSYQLSQQLVLGASFNAPYGLTTKPENRAWVGQTQARDTIVKTYNGQIALGYRLLPTLSIGGGVMVEYIDADLKSAAGASAGAPDSSVRGNDTSVGWTAGITWQALPGTNIGVGYRSQIEHTLTGSALIDTTTRSVGVKAGVTLPETATISLRQALTPQLAFLASAEWTKWSRLDKLDVVCQAAEAVLCPGGAGTLATSLPFHWHDSWFYSAGLEYSWSPSLTLRAGGAWEKSPIQNPSERSPRVPDNDRIWGSVGATAKVNDIVSVDFAYTHIWVDDGQIDRTASGVRLLADVKSDIDIFSGSIKFKLGATPPPPEPLK